MLGDFEDQSVVYSFNFESVKNGGKTLFELDIDNSSDNLRNFSISFFGEVYGIIIKG
jgi:hypothetical protein